MIEYRLTRAASQLLFCFTQRIFIPKGAHRAIDRVNRVLLNFTFVGLLAYFRDTELLANYPAHHVRQLIMPANELLSSDFWNSKLPTNYSRHPIFYFLMSRNGRFHACVQIDPLRVFGTFVIKCATILQKMTDKIATFQATCSSCAFGFNDVRPSSSSHWHCKRKPIADAKSSIASDFVSPWPLASGICGQSAM